MSWARDDELRSLRAFLDRPAAAGMTALVLEGEAGIGKSTLWLAGVEAARERGLRVLSSRPAEVEVGSCLRRAGRPAGGRARQTSWPELAAPRRRALETALLLGNGGERAGRLPNACGGRPQRAPAARRARADPDRGRRRPVAGPAFRRRPRVRAEAIAGREHPTPASARRLGAGISVSELELAVGRRLGRALARRPAQPGRVAGDPATAARPGARAPDAAAPPRSLGRQSILRPRARPRPRRQRRPHSAAARAGVAGRARTRSPRRVARRDASSAVARVHARPAGARPARRPTHSSRRSQTT